MIICRRDGPDQRTDAATPAASSIPMITSAAMPTMFTAAHNQPVVSRPTTTSMTSATNTNSSRTNSESFDITRLQKRIYAGSSATSVTEVIRPCDEQLLSELRAIFGTNEDDGSKHLTTRPPIPGVLGKRSDYAGAVVPRGRMRPGSRGRTRARPKLERARRPCLESRRAHVSRD